MIYSFLIMQAWRNVNYEIFQVISECASCLSKSQSVVAFLTRVDPYLKALLKASNKNLCKRNLKKM